MKATNDALIMKLLWSLIQYRDSVKGYVLKAMYNMGKIVIPDFEKKGRLSPLFRGL